uniref:Out at first protein BRICHOS-like domain-containing protein n=1 Tax=Anopheles maculatus TaxID=74869 RepID=A0A182SSM9_9DIPT
HFLSSFLTYLQEVQVLKALVLGEEERGQSQYQVMCFVTKFQKGDFITADAMVKLRQVRNINFLSSLTNKKQPSSSVNPGGGLILDASSECPHRVTSSGRRLIGAGKGRYSKRIGNVRFFF